ncbi:3-keto-5-aminohexanoate cleavage protein [Ruegeria meonggei]|uniref:3-keto-5-aminohexanoate cleavage enzyme n=1 Tax=Ruegeria meonggei TaxID=1446476 RepID=A0A1X7A2T0_9RHOB|nr:3-keto-5-aminohexanoate cleavage protein [Ruegeria meonggei]SLN68523.1 3-keto-5-aminohexanoate cleavage enzyme [Ruegeria meonggei]
MTDTRSRCFPYILVAPNGARRGASDHVMLPMSMDQIVDTGHRCFDAGANGLHLHIRDAQGRHTLDAGQYLETMAELRQKVPHLDIQITTEAAGVFDVETQYNCLRDVRPEWVSISVREIAREPALASRVYGLCSEQGTRVQHILYDADDAAQLAHWHEAGIVAKEQSDCLLVLGRYVTGQESSPKDLDQFPADASDWMVCAFGSQEHACLVYAAHHGADVRVGFENSLTDRDGNVWKDNAASVSALIATLEGALK